MPSSALEFPFVPPHPEQVLAVLDDPQEWAAFSRPDRTDSAVWNSNVLIEGMHCAACAVTVEDALLRVPGVLRARVSAASGRAQVLWSALQVQPSHWMQAVQQVGYRAVPANDVFATELRRQEARKALWRWLVAGLCMMQVMMYAYPAYTARPGDLSAEMEQLLRWASWVLSLPVMLFSCGPFFRNAMRDIGRGRISMDWPVALGITVTFAVSTAGTFDPHGVFGREVYFDSLTMFVFFLLSGRWLELRLRDRTAGALEALMNRVPESAERRTAQGDWERVAARRVRLGDVLRVHPGEAFVADGVVELGRTEVDEALLTGESHSVARSEGMQVVAGSHNLGATVQMRVQRIGGDTRFAQIVALMQSAAISKPQVALLADRVAKPFLLAVLVVAAGACAWWWPQSPSHALMVAVAVLVVTCPCALSLATPAAMLATAGSLARQGVLVRQLGALETLASVDTVVFDKTGTLTTDAMALSQLRVRDGEDATQVTQMVRALAQHSLHPVSRALVRAFPSEVDSAMWVCNGVTEVTGQGVHGTVFPVGSPSESADGTQLWLGRAAFCGISPPPVDARDSVPRPAGVQVHLKDAQGWLASFDLQEAIRPEAPQAVQALQALGLQVHLLSGDGAEQVAAVAARVGIVHVQAQCSPDGKLDYLRALQARGCRVAMVGDGMNDGPVLAGAQVSFAFGRAVPLAQAQSDLVLMGGDVRSVVQAVHRSRKTMRVVRQNLAWALAYNAACVPLALVGALPAWLAGLGMASSSLLVVLNALRLAPKAVP